MYTCAKDQPTAEQRQLPESMDLYGIGNQTFADLTVPYYSSMCEQPPACKPEQVDFEMLIQDLLTDDVPGPGGRREEDTADPKKTRFEDKLDGCEPDLAELKPQDIRVILSKDNADEFCQYEEASADDVLVEMATGVSPAVQQPAVNMTHEPQVLSQSSFPKPWEQEQSSGASDASSSHDSTCHDQDQLDLDAKVDYMKRALNRYDKIVLANSSNGKIQVHQVVLFLLLANARDNAIGANLSGILNFCDSDGKPTRKCRDHFKAVNTKAMGLVWQKVKGNRNANYDTFARAMRVGRERCKEYFSYLDSGRSSKKRVYKLGGKSLSEMDRLERMLPEICTDEQ